MLVVVTETVEADLLSICRRLGPSAIGETLARDFTKQIENLRVFPNMGVTDHPLGMGRRAVFLAQGEYVMTYEILEDKVMLRRLFHGSRDPKRA